MKFLLPSFLFALFALLIPVIIHLFSFRKFRKVNFPDIRFLKEIRQEKRTSSRLRHLLVLFSRILFLAFLILAFAQPYIPGENEQAFQGERSFVSVFVDNSFSMNATGEGGRMLDVAKSKAREAVMAYNPSDRFQLLTNDFEAQHQELLTREGFLDLLDEVEETPASKTAGEVIRRQHDLLSRSGNGRKDLFLISDFQSAFTQLSDLPADSLATVYLIPIEANENPNLYIDSVWFPSPVRKSEGIESISALVKNSGNRDVENTPVQIFINGEQKSPSSVTVPAGGESELTINFSHTGSGIKSGKISLQDHPVTYDDDFYFSYNVKEQIPVLIINGENENPYLNSFLQTENYFKFENSSENNVDYSRLNSFNVIILNQLKEVSSGLVSAIKAFTEQGGHTVLFPSLEIDPATYNTLLSSLNAGSFTLRDTSDIRISNVDQNHEVFRGVFERTPDALSMPLLTDRFRFRDPSSGKLIPIMDAGTGDLYLGSADRSNGRIYVFTSPPEISTGNFPQHAFFAPVMYNIILSSQRSGDLYNFLGTNQPVQFQGEITGKERLVSIRSTEEKFEMIPEIYPSGGSVYLNLHDGIPNAGNYIVSYEGEDIQGLSLNFNRQESELSYSGVEALTELAGTSSLAMRVVKSAGKNLSKEVRELNQGTPLWKYCIWLALLFLLTEVLLLRFGGKSSKNYQAT